MSYNNNVKCTHGENTKATERPMRDYFYMWLTIKAYGYELAIYPYND